MVYIVEDDNNIRELIVYTLESIGMTAKGFETPEEFWKCMGNNENPELIILDIMLPKEDGISILKKIRSNSKTTKIPVILLTAKGNEYDKVLGLDTGADDYVTKPFGIMELMSRVKALLRRTEKIVDNTIILKDLTINKESHIVTVLGENIVLTLKEFELLLLLIESKGRVISRDELLNRIWGYSFDGENRTVDVHIRTLRQKLGECGSYVETVRGKGYKIGGKNK